MKPKLLLFVVLVGFLRSIDCTMIYAQRGGGQDPAPAGPAPDSKPAPKPRTRWQKPLALPEQHRSKDKDKDGQIGMYEWPRNDFATFRKLDLNHDGFLTAAELTRGASSKPASSVATGTSTAARPEAPGTAASAAAAPPKASAETAAKTGDDEAGDADDDSDEPATPAKEKPPTPTPSAGRSDAERQWEVVDKDKDGKVTEEEWGRSYYARPKFRDAGINVSFPMTKEEFTQLWSQLPGSGK